MAALYPGYKTLYLSLSRPFDNYFINGIVDNSLRDDIIGVKVWYSTSASFDPAGTVPSGTLVYDGGYGGIITINNLQSNTTYYVKYAYISQIDPEVISLSEAISATTVPDNMELYGYLTNDPTIVPTDSDGLNGDFSGTSGIFKTYYKDTEVTGQSGIAYQIKSDSATGGIVATINATTGAYSCTAITSLSGTVTFEATYTVPDITPAKTITIEKTLNVSKLRSGSTAPAVTLTADRQSFIKPKNSDTIWPTSILLTATVNNILNPKYVWEIAGTVVQSPDITPSVNSDELTLVSFTTPIAKTVKVTVTSTTVSSISAFDLFTVYYLKEGDDSIIAALVNENQTISYKADETVVSGQLPITSEMLVVRGIELLSSSTTPSVTFSVGTVSGFTGATISSSGVINIANITANSASAKFIATVNTNPPLVLEKELTANKSVDGKAASISIGTVTTSSSSSSASVVNSGDANAAVLDFTIPKGDKGDKGDDGQDGQDGQDGSTGSSVNIVFQRSASQPSTPGQSASTPTGWYDTVSSVPASSSLLWSSVGYKVVGGTVFTWNTPVQVQAENGLPGTSVAEISIFLRSTSTPSTPSGGVFDFSVPGLSTIPNGWSDSIPSGTDPIWQSKTVAASSTINGTDTTLNWTTPVKIAQNGDIGQTGQSNYRAYAKNSSTSSPPTWSQYTEIGSLPGVAWSNSPPSLDTGEVQWQIDGVLAVGSTQILWAAPYLSYFKVGSLRAITANIGEFSSATASGETIINGDTITIKSNGIVRVKIGKLN